MKFVVRSGDFLRAVILEVPDGADLRRYAELAAAQAFREAAAEGGGVVDGSRLGLLTIIQPQEGVAWYIATAAVLRTIGAKVGEDGPDLGPP